MKNVTLTLVLFLTVAYAHSQPGTLTNIQVSQRTDGSGFVDIYFNLSGSAEAYNMSLEASFDAGSSYQPVPAAHLSGDVTSVGPGNNKHLVWDGFASFPNEYSTQSKLKLLATAITGGGIPGSGVTDIDGNFYPSVIIGNQEWMAENLRVTRDASGNNITRYCYGNNTANCLLYGGLYKWATIMNGAGSSNSNPSGVQGICPDGWHVPSVNEWIQLISNLEGGELLAGKLLKSCRQVNSPLGGECTTDNHPRWNEHETFYGTDNYNFSLLPGGELRIGNDFQGYGWSSPIWTSYRYSSTRSWAIGVTYSSDSIDIYHTRNTRGYSLRCIKTN